MSRTSKTALFFHGFLFLACSIATNIAQTQNMQTPFEENPNTSASYSEIIRYYRQLVKKHDILQMDSVGQTDIGLPLYSIVLDKDKSFSPTHIRSKSGKCVLFINNGIHPGEPEGIDATMMLIRDLVTQEKWKPLLKKVVIVVIPIYNVDGCLNRGSYSRTNQIGPEAYGFRGNAQNLDLNRDFIKCDSKNAASFNQIFAKWSPDIFIDNHTSNGADYPYTMTLIPTQHNKLPPALGDFLQQSLLPFLYEDMARRNWEMTPYVNTADEEGKPETGIYGFLDHPRYSTGYAALHHCIGFMPETHMLKPFPARVHSTYAFMESVLSFLEKNHTRLLAAKNKGVQQYLAQQEAPIQWKLDESQQDSIEFKGYEAKYKPSQVSGLPRLYYDTKSPFTRNIPYWNTYKATTYVKIPPFYLIPQAYTSVIQRLQWNGVEMERLTTDKEYTVEVDYIQKTQRFLFEGHYRHDAIETTSKIQTLPFRKGDYLVRTQQPAMRYIIETLEPKTADSFFAWNFFDGILHQKEHFSDYVFEDLAADFLAKNPKIQAELRKLQANDPKFAQDAHAQLEWVYRRSPYYEPSHNRYPIVRGIR